MDSYPDCSEESQVRGSLSLASQPGRCVGPAAEHLSGHVIAFDRRTYPALIKLHLKERFASVESGLSQLRTYRM